MARTDRVAWPGMGVRLVGLLIVAGWVASYGWPMEWGFGRPGVAGYRLSIGHGVIQVFGQRGWFTAGGPGLGTAGPGVIPFGAAGAAMAGPVIATPPWYSMDLSRPGRVSIRDARWRGGQPAFIGFPAPDPGDGSAGLGWMSSTSRLPVGLRGTGPVVNVGYWSVGVPIWLGLVLVFGAWGAGAWRRLSRVEKGLCPGCGYDLRATPERCPECGRVVEGTV